MPPVTKLAHRIALLVQADPAGGLSRTELQQMLRVWDSKQFKAACFVAYRRGWVEFIGWQYVVAPPPDAPGRLTSPAPVPQRLCTLDAPCGQADCAACGVGGWGDCAICRAQRTGGCTCADWCGQPPCTGVAAGRRIRITVGAEVMDVLIRDGAVAAAAPAARWAVGRDEHAVARWYRDRGATFGEVPGAAA